jgi:hypothetical protein
MLGEQGVVEQIALGRNLAALDGAGDKLVPFLGLAITATEPHQGYEFGLLARGHSLDLLHYLLAAEVVILVLQGPERNLVIDRI